MDVYDYTQTRLPNEMLVAPKDFSHAIAQTSPEFTFQRRTYPDTAEADPLDHAALSLIDYTTREIPAALNLIDDTAKDAEVDLLDYAVPNLIDDTAKESPA